MPTTSLQHSRFYCRHANAPPHKWLLIIEPNTFPAVSQLEFSSHFKVAGFSFGNHSSIINKIAFVWISTLESLVFTCTATQWAHPAHEIYHRSGGRGGGRGGMVFKGISGSIRLPVWRHVSLRWLSKWQTKCSSKRWMKISNLSPSMLFRFLGSRDFKIAIVIAKQALVLFWSETSSGVGNF